MTSVRIEAKPLAQLQDKLGYQFKNEDVLRQALTHVSAMREEHLLAARYNQSSLAFIGDAALKYAVARYLFLNGREDVAQDRSELHRGTQTVIPNNILAEIAREKLHLEDYIIRGKRPDTVSNGMYADCIEAILGAISLDCGTDQEAVFCVVEKLCSDRYENLLQPISVYRFKSVIDDEEEELIMATRSLWDHFTQNREILYRPIRLELPKKSFSQKFVEMLVWIFALCGFAVILWKVMEFAIFQLQMDPQAQSHEL